MQPSSGDLNHTSVTEEMSQHTTGDTGPMAEPVVESVVIQADAGRIYDLIADVARMGEWSPEATGAHGAGSSPVQGERFIGANRRGQVRWYTVCTVLDAERGTRFAFDVDFGPIPLSRWAYDLQPQEGATKVTESWVDRREGISGPPMKLMGQLLIPGSRPAHNRATMVETLQRLKSAAES